MLLVALVRVIRVRGRRSDSHKQLMTMPAIPVAMAARQRRDFMCAPPRTHQQTRTYARGPSWMAPYQHSRHGFALPPRAYLRLRSLRAGAVPIYPKKRKS